MNFTQVDPVLLAWSSNNRIPLSTQYQDAEVRSFELVGTAGRAQIWVEVNGQVSVHVWDYKKRKQSFAATVGTLEATLDQALAMARVWI